MKPRKKEQTEQLNEAERNKLESEYKELCHDWRLRDKYVLDKLPAAGILFGLLGVAVAYIPSTLWWIKLSLLSIGSLYAMVLSISVAKDTYYRDGTTALLKRLFLGLNIHSSFQTLKSIQAESYPEDGLDLQELQFPRKISIRQDKSTIKLWGPTVLKDWLRNWLLVRATFRWILAFYLVSFSIFVTLFILILVNHICKLNLPI